MGESGRTVRFAVRSRFQPARSPGERVDQRALAGGNFSLPRDERDLSVQFPSEVEPSIAVTTQPIMFNRCSRLTNRSDNPPIAQVI